MKKEKKITRRKFIKDSAIAAAGVSALAVGTPSGLSLFARNAHAQSSLRAEILKMKDKALKELYKLNPGAKAEIASAKGYAVFGNTGINVLVVSSGNGAGVAYKDGKPTYMKMYSAGVGVGVGVKKFYAIFIIKTTQAYDNFVEEGWQAGKEANQPG